MGADPDQPRSRSAAGAAARRARSRAGENRLRHRGNARAPGPPIGWGGPAQAGRRGSAALHRPASHSCLRHAGSPTRTGRGEAGHRASGHHRKRQAGDRLRAPSDQARGRRCAGGGGDHLQGRPRPPRGRAAAARRGRRGLARISDAPRQSGAGPVDGRRAPGAQHALPLHDRGMAGRLRELARGDRQEARRRSARGAGADRGSGASGRGARPGA